LQTEWSSLHFYLSYSQTVNINKMLSKIITFLGALILAHAAYSAHHYRRLVADSSFPPTLPFSSFLPSFIISLLPPSLPPADILIELLASFLLILIGQVLPLSLRPVRMTPDKTVRSFEEVMGRPEFASFRHRGRAMGEKKSSQR